MVMFNSAKYQIMLWFCTNLRFLVRLSTSLKILTAVLLRLLRHMDQMIDQRLSVLMV